MNPIHLRRNRGFSLARRVLGLVSGAVWFAVLAGPAQASPAPAPPVPASPASAASAPAAPAPALTAALQAEVDVAVRAYEAGQFDAARAGFESLAERQVPAAEYNLAVMHLRGEMPHPDLAVARALLVRAGAAGFITAQVMLARALEGGELGLRDLAQAHDWYELAAESGDTESQLAMGTAYFLGRGRAKDLAQALRWYREAARTGDVGAMYIVASMYEHGDGTEADLRLARYWYAAAARAGDPAAPGKLKELDARPAAQAI